MEDQSETLPPVIEEGQRKITLVITVTPEGLEHELSGRGCLTELSVLLLGLERMKHLIMTQLLDIDESSVNGQLGRVLGKGGWLS